MCEETKGYTCFWRVENFILRNSNPNLLLKSPEFEANWLNSHWYIILKQTIPGCIGLYLYKRSNRNKCKVNISVSLLKSTGWETILKKHPFEFEAGGVGCGVDRLVGWKDIVREEWVYLPCGSLTVNVQISNEDLIVRKSAQWLMISRMKSAVELKHLPVQKFRDLKPSHLLNFPASYTLKTAEDFKMTEINSLSSDDDIVQLLKKMDLNFVTLKTKDKEFSVLKAVLCTKSPVFKAMFDGKMIESFSNSVNIDDIDSDTMSSLIEYLHHKLILSNLDWSKAMKLYYAADKYQIKQLKETCLSSIRHKISFETVCEAFVLADMHQDKVLRESAQEFFSKNSKVILKSAEWKNFLLNYTELASEILCNLADNL